MFHRTKGRPTPMSSPPSSQATYLLEQAVLRSKRTVGIQLMPTFVRISPPATWSPLGKMLRGGRGGEVRLKLYLTMILVATRKPHEITDEIPASVWAEMLDLSEPKTVGARRVSDALQWLQTNRYVLLDSKRGRPPKIALLSVSGDGTPYARGQGQYISVPLDLWQHHWITNLSGRSVALLLILLDLQGGRTPGDPPSLTANRRKRYDVSDDTWKRAQDELVSAGLLHVDPRKTGDIFEVRRVRNTYWIDLDRLARPAGQ